MKRSYFISFLFICIGLNLCGQIDDTSLKRSKIIVITDAFQLIDSFAILISKTQINFRGNRIKGHCLDISNKYIRLTKNNDCNLSKGDSLFIEYQIFPVNFDNEIKHLDSSYLIQKPNEIISGAYLNPYQLNDEILDFGKIDYDGSFARGISVGNAQSLILNSDLNLQLSGFLGDGIELSAAISDRNIPIQPEGNTQQIQEFDKIFIKLKQGSNALIAGDFDLQRPNSYFLNYFKKLQGIRAESLVEKANEQSLTTNLSAAITRGKFSRNEINAIEGNQGPYRLQGSQGEKFIIVLAGSEKLYIDGILLKRGELNDYIIDYNRAEIRFTNKRLITKDLRIIVEFEHSDQNYLRSLVAGNANYQNKSWTFGFHFYNEQDSKNTTGNIELSAEDRSILSQSGDDFDNTFKSSIVKPEDGFNLNLIMYQMIDTLGHIDVLQYSRDPSKAMYTASFTDLGPNNGNYILSAQNSANGRIFEWIAPDPISQQARGNYAPIFKLTPPEQKSIIAGSANYQFKNDGQMGVELSISNTDLNRLSENGDSDNTGAAIRLFFDKSLSLGAKEDQWSVSTSGDYEFKSIQFNALNPYRNPEFRRDWNIENEARFGEHLTSARIRLSKNQIGHIQYDLNAFNQQTNYKGLINRFNTNLNWKGFKITSVSSWLNSTSFIEKSNFARPNIELSKSFEKLAGLTVGIKGLREKNSRYDLQIDTLNQSSFYFDTWGSFIKLPVNENYGFQVSYDQRTDFKSSGQNFKAFSFAEDFLVGTNFSVRKHSKFNANVGIRNLEIDEQLEETLNDQRTYIAKVNYSLRALDNAIIANSFYEIGSGQEPLIEYKYLSVPAGEGFYIWNDNGDSIQQVQEFQIAPFQDQANFVRISVFNDQFIRVNYNAFNQSLRTDWKKTFYDKTNWTKVFSKFSSLSTLKINRRTRISDQLSVWNPFELNIDNESLVSIQSIMNHILYFNRGDSKYDLQIGHSNTINKVQLSSGFEANNAQESYSRMRITLAKKLSSISKVTIGYQNNDSQFFDDNDYQISQSSIQTELNWIPSPTIRLKCGYSYKLSNNDINLGGEKAVFHDVKLESNFREIAKTSLRLSGSLVQLSYDGVKNTPVSFAMLQGLQNGQNFLWSAIAERQIAKNIQLDISYEGRKTGDARIVHVGRAQIRALF